MRSHGERSDTPRTGSVKSSGLKLLSAVTPATHSKIQHSANSIIDAMPCASALNETSSGCQTKLWPHGQIGISQPRVPQKAGGPKASNACACARIPASNFQVVARSGLLADQQAVFIQCARHTRLHQNACTFGWTRFSLQPRPVMQMQRRTWAPQASNTHPPMDLPDSAVGVNRAIWHDTSPCEMSNSKLKVPS